MKLTKRAMFSWLCSLVLSAVLSINQSEALIGVSCSDNSQCNVTNNEQCGFNAALFPQCQRQVCACQPCFIAIGPNCIPKQYLTSLGEPCNGTQQETITIPLAECRMGQVLCKRGYVASGFTKCLQNMTCDPQTLLSSCPQYAQCSNEGRCVCTLGTKWDDAKQLCTPRLMGDPCNTTADCAFSRAGSGQNSYGFSGYSRMAGVSCTQGRCGCAAGFKVAAIGYTESATLGWQNRAICVPENSPIDLQTGQPCSLPDPIQASNNAMVSVCGPDSICRNCPFDERVSWTMGTCRQVDRLKVAFEEMCMAMFGKQQKSSAPSNYGRQSVLFYILADFIIILLSCAIWV